MLGFTSPFNHTGRLLTAALLATMLWAGLSAPLSAQEIDFDWFTSDTPLVATIRTDLRQISNKRFSEEYVKGNFTTTTEAGEINIPIRLKARGVFRKEYCTTPPMRMKLDKELMDDSLLKKRMDVKLVIQCKSQDSFDDFLLTEYLTYRMYQSLTPYSFRTRLLTVTWINERKPEAPKLVQHVIVVEDVDQLAARLECTVVENANVTKADLDPDAFIRQTMFEYLIGNTDWSIRGQHNVKILQSMDPVQYLVVPVPYDFDYSGMVNAPYAVPDPRLDILDVRSRMYMGPCLTEPEIQAAVSPLLAQQENWRKMFESFELLEPRYRDGVLKFMDQFFDLAKDPAYMRKKMSIKCIE